MTHSPHEMPGVLPDLEVWPSAKELAAFAPAAGGCAAVPTGVEDNGMWLLVLFIPIHQAIGKHLQ